jgi:hypothetical protein
MEVGRVNLPTFLFSMELKEYISSWKKLADGLENVLVKQMHDNKSLFEEFITEQLYSGINGNELPLRPRYSEDPYFNIFKNPKDAAQRYKKWKAKIQPPASSYLGFTPRDIDTPNLIIRGDFYSSITAIPIADGISITSQGLTFSADIEHKYGMVIYKIGEKAKIHYMNYYLIPRINKFIKECGL